jgi:putative restriction endonuclease
MPDLDTRVRLATFAFLDERTRLYGEVIPRDVLVRGLDLDGRRIPLVGPQGIFKPAVLNFIPLSITTSPPVPDRPRPYDDAITEAGLLRYSYRGTNPQHHENRGLRAAMAARAPLVYFHGVVPGLYVASWPVFIVADDPAGLAFTVAVDDKQFGRTVADAIDDAEADIRRRYVTRQTTQRVHQVVFRQRVLQAYREHCAICHLRHQELLDAAHILPDGHPRGEPVVQNGLALCKLRHAAFDANILGIRPDCRVDLRLDILQEADGLMLKEGLQRFQDQRIWTPRAVVLRPRPEFLEERYDMFRRAS